ncbi:DUF4350 domain-containing protein [uncultured Pseudokineococcus sp.]|uniref:DUF4350 domain-containing protein n=1 Tax=uncultured Pseudokineococcus sp. TaxID=1642928 RepID=UPI002627A4FB|nr:DUF4350 domain-containing protein [uncultured Pseudokineococcus sp.]
MSSAAPAAAGAPPESARDRPRGPRRPRRGPVALALLAVLVLVALVVGSRGTGRGVLDPTSPEPDGARAVAQVLGDLGVEVTRTTSTAATLDDVRAAGRGGAAVLVVPTAPLGTAQLEDLAASGADLLLVQPTADDLAVLAPSLRLGDDVEAASAVPPQCDLPAATAAGPATGGGALVEPRDDEDPDVTLCYGLPFGGAPYAVVDAPGGDADAGGRAVVLGQPDVLRNETVADEGNAALALATLGARDTLVWYLPDPLDPALSDEPLPLSALVPPGLVRAAQVLGVAALLLLLWRGRRLGRLVPERLPVVVRAAEAVEGRGRLYRASGDRAHAAAVLRSACLGRLAGRLGVPPSAGAPAVVAATAAATGRPAAEVDALLRSPAPGDDEGLVRLAHALDALEREVRRS